MKFSILMISFITIFSSIGMANAVEKLKLPPNFYFEVYADNIDSARAMSFDEKGNLYVGTRKSGKVYVITKDKKVYVIARGLSMPVGVDYYRGDLYVSDISKILVFRNISQNFTRAIKPEVLSNKFPKDTWHGWKFIKIGPDNKIYIPVGAPCNVCLKKDRKYSSIMRMNLDGSGLEVFAHGVRNTVGFDWHPITGDLWFTENGRDWMGDNVPPDELNVAKSLGLHFGFPFKHGVSIKDPSYWSKRNRIKYTDPVYEFQAHVAALGMRFYTGKMFPDYYKNGIFVAEHGSWNRSSKVGYRISFLKLRSGSSPKYEVFADEFLMRKIVLGRPADVEIGPDGSLFISDDYSDKIYRIYYRK